MTKEKKRMDLALAGFYEAMERTNVEKITDEMLAGLSGDLSDSESFDVESDNDDTEDRPWRSSHVVFGKSTVNKGQIEAMKGKYFHDISIVRARGENTVPHPKADEVVIFKSFMKAGLCFPLHKMLVEVLKKFEIYLHRLTPEALIKVRVFIWAMRSQGLEPDAKCFCNIHELSFQTKAVGKEQYHNNFRCYSFMYRSDVRCHVSTFRKKWLGSWMIQWFYVKNYLSERDDVKSIILRPIRSHFGIRRPSIAGVNEAQACLMAFNTMCNYIGTRDLVQEHIAFKVWPLVNDWEMPKDTAAGSSVGDLVYLKYTYRYRSQFGEPNNEWLEAVKATSDELLGAYMKAEDEAMNTAFGAHGKRRLNRVFDVIGFTYHDYCFPTQKQGTKRKISSKPSFTVPNSKKTKVLTHRSKLHF
jgi:hypothetical protein